MNKIRISAYRKIDDGHYEIFFENNPNIIMADFELVDRE